MVDPGFRNDLLRAESRRLDTASRRAYLTPVPSAHGGRARAALAVALAAGSIFAITAATAHGATAVEKRTLPIAHMWGKGAHHHHRSPAGQIILRPAAG